MSEEREKEFKKLFKTNGLNHAILYWIDANFVEKKDFDAAIENMHEQLQSTYHEGGSDALSSIR